MKKRMALALILALCLTGCGSSAGEAPTEPELLLVESRPVQTVTEGTPGPEETTQPELSTAATEAVQKPEDPSRETTAPTEAAASSKATVPPALPVITKEPTPETVTQGGEAWFVARADGAEAITWWFTAPDSSEDLSSAQVAARFPELTIQGADRETLVLGNLPTELNGWTAQAEFSNAAGGIRSQTVLLTVKPAVADLPVPEAYETVLSNCRFVLSFDPGQQSMEELGQQDYYQLYDGRDLLGRGLGYTLVDLDGNGQEELLLGIPGDSILYALFTQQNGSPIKVLQSWARNRHYYCGGNLIYHEGSSGAADSAAALCHLSGNQLRTDRVLWSSSTYQEGTMSCFRSEDGTRAEDSEHLISLEDYQAGLDAMQKEAPPLILGLTPIS